MSKINKRQGYLKFNTMIDRKNISPFLYLILLLGTIQTAFAVEIKATLDRNPISVNESVQLTFTATESPDDDPDFGVLKQDFDILNQTQSSNSSWINGKSSKSIQWVLNIMPKKTGNIMIPSVPFGDDNSQPILLRVTQSQATNTNQNADLFLQVEVSTQSPYVQEQVLYTLKLFSRVQLSQARLSELEMPDALVEKLGDVKKYSINRNGVEYTVNELNYAIFPQKSGMINIAPMVLSADVVTRSRPQFNSFFNRQMTRTKRVQSNAISLNVKAVPANFKGTRWIPASQLVIQEKWSGKTEQMKVGEPLTRTLTILAVGNTVAQLPELYKDTAIANIKTYPDQPVLKEQKKAEGLISFREEKIAYIPSKAGKYTLPAIEIPWFNTQTQKMELAKVAEQTIEAIGPAVAQTNHFTDIKPEPEKVLEKNVINPTKPIIQTVENPFWMWLSIFFATGWILTILFILLKRKPKQVEEIDNSAEINLKQAVKALRKACSENDAIAAKNALLAWGKASYGGETLSAIAPYCEARLRDEILLLNQCLYADQAKPWKGKKLFQAFSENKARKTVDKKKNNELEPLYRV